jgi:hypothetical protein
VPITRVVDTDDSGSGTTGTIRDNAWLQSIYDSIEDTWTWTTPTFAAGSYAGNGAMTWTVGSSDVVTFAYIIRGNTMTLSFYIAATTVGGTPNSTLTMTIPAGAIAAKAMLMPFVYNDNGAGNAPGYAVVSAGGTTVDLLKLPGIDYSGTPVAVNWTAATNATNVYGQIMFEIQ